MTLEKYIGVMDILLEEYLKNNKINILYNCPEN